MIECIGRVTELHTKTQRNFKRFKTEIVKAKLQRFHRKVNARQFDSRKKWNFKTGETKYFTSQLVYRINSKPSPWCFME